MADLKEGLDHVVGGDTVSTSPVKMESGGSTSGYTLQSKPTSVTLGRIESLTKKANAPDALEETKDFVSLPISAPLIDGDDAKSG